MKKLNLGNALAALALGGALVLATAPKAHADNDGRSRCQNRLEEQTGQNSGRTRADEIRA